MGLGDDDLSAGALALAMPGRPLRTYPALVSTEADAVAWARSGAPDGAVVTAGYQVAPRGRGGLPWQVRQDRDLAFSVILRPALTSAREGWVYAVAVTGLADALGGEVTISWPDEVRYRGSRAGAVGVTAELELARVAWAVVNVFVPQAARPRAALLARIVAAIEERQRASDASVLAAYRARCETIGRRVRARLIPLSPGGPQVTGTAGDIFVSGALAIITGAGRRVTVWPQNLGVLEEPDEDIQAGNGR